MEPRREQSFGVVPLRKSSVGWEVFLIQHAKSRYWGFPKGHGEEGESPQEAAIRELKEETNLDIVQILREEPFEERYTFRIEGQQVHKQVLYFAAEVAGTVQLQAHEVQNGMWVSLEEAMYRLTHVESKSILKQVTAIL